MRILIVTVVYHSILHDKFLRNSQSWHLPDASERRPSPSAWLVHSLSEFSDRWASSLNICKRRGWRSNNTTTVKGMRWETHPTYWLTLSVSLIARRAVLSASIFLTDQQWQDIRLTSQARRQRNEPVLGRGRRSGSIDEKRWREFWRRLLTHRHNTSWKPKEQRNGKRTSDTDFGRLRVSGCNGS